MKLPVNFWVVVVTASLFAQSALAADEATPRVVGYFAEWTDYAADQLPADKLTHINYAFGVIKNGECSIQNEEKALKKFAGLRELKQKHPTVKTLVSIGGWTDSGPFSDAALTSESRAKFATSCADFVTKHGFDGVDIDWEYPGGGGMDKTKGRPEDTKNFTSLLTHLRAQLDAIGKGDGKHYLLTIAAPAGGASSRIELPKVAQILDFINLMTYDFAGEWSKTTAFNSPLFAAKDDPNPRENTAASVETYLKAGVPPDKLCVGVPFYGRAWGGVKDVNHGLFQPHHGKPPRAPGSYGDWSYRGLAANHVDKSGTKRFWNDEAKVPWLFNAETGLFVTYDDPQSIRGKAEFVREHHLGGVMIWELSEDDEQSSMLSAIRAGLGEGR